MNWEWVIAVSITLGIATAGGIWALVKVVAVLSARAATIEAQLSMVLPTVSKVPTIEQHVAVLNTRVDAHSSVLDWVRSKISGHQPSLGRRNTRDGDGE